MAQISSKSQFLVRKPPFHSRTHDRGAGSRLRVLRIRPRSNRRSSSPVRRLVSSLQFANTSVSQNQNRRWTLHARVASIVSTSPQAVISPEMPACSHVAVPPRKPASPHCQAGYDSMGLSYEKPRRPFRCCQVLGTSLPNGKRVPCPRRVHHDVGRMIHGQRFTTALPCAGGPHSTYVWTFAQKTAPASAGLSTQDTLPEPRVGQLKNASES